MSTLDVSALLRPRLLEGVSIVLAGAAPAATHAHAERVGLGGAVGGACALLGARVVRCVLAGDRPLGLEQTAIEQATEEALAGVLADGGSVELLAVDGASLFDGAAGAASDDAREALRVCLDASWNVTRAVANRAFLPGARGGRIVYLTPTRDQGEHAAAARAGLENLARTLSIEWARHGITAVAIAPGAGAAAAAAGAARAQEVAVLTAYLASPAGAYFSGCLLDLAGTGAG